MPAAEVIFYLFAGLSIVSALAMVLNVRNTVAAAMSLVVTMISLGAIYVVLEAFLVAALQIMVYAGAIVVVFLFVVMLLNLRRDEFPAHRQLGVKILAVCLAALAALVFLRWIPGALPEVVALPEGYGGYREVARALYTDFVLPFEVTSLLLLGAMVGAVVLAKRRLD